ncbi:hypothetical protein GN156_26485, partial [bacterium LRH843]|nr:hypothetical protein [bacterium LRH843]
MQQVEQAAVSNGRNMHAMPFPIGQIGFGHITWIGVLSFVCVWVMLTIYAAVMRSQSNVARQQAYNFFSSWGFA